MESQEERIQSDAVTLYERIHLAIVCLPPIDGPGRTNDKLARIIGVSSSTVCRARVLEKVACQEVKDRLMAGTTTINHEYAKLRPGPSLHSSRARIKRKPRIEQIRDLGARGFRSDQISAEIGISAELTRRLARDNGISLPDDVIGRVMRPEVNRIVSETVVAAQSLTAGLGLVDSRLEGLDTTQIDGWVRSLADSVNALNRLINSLRRRRCSNE